MGLNIKIESRAKGQGAKSWCVDFHSWYADGMDVKVEVTTTKDELNEK